MQMDALPDKLIRRTVQMPTSKQSINKAESDDDSEDSSLLPNGSNEYLSSRPLIGSPLSPPKDRYKMVYMIFYLVGVSTLLPWNMFITAKDYFSYQLRNTSAPADEYDDPKMQTDLQLSYESSVAIASMVPSIIMQFVTSALTGRVTVAKRMISSMVLMLLMFIFTLVLTKVGTSSWQTTFYAVTLAAVVIISSASSLISSSMFGLAAKFPKSYTAACMGGMGLGGVFAAVADVITLSIGGGVLDSAFWYFLLACIVVLLALTAFILLPKLEYSRFYANQYETVSFEEAEATKKSFFRELLDIYKKIWYLSLSAMFVFLITLAMFPATTSNVQSVNKNNGSIWTGKYFLPLYCFLLFNMGDLVGRTVGGWLNMPKPKLLIPLASLLRIVFIPLFALCNVQPRSSLPVVFTSDAYPVVIMAVFAVSNGYLSTQAIMLAPSLVSRQQAELTGVVMSCSMTIGLSLGSLLSYAVTLAIKNI